MVVLNESDVIANERKSNVLLNDSDLSSLTVTIKNKAVIDILKKYKEDYQSEIIEEAMLYFMNGKKKTMEFFTTNIMSSTEECFDYVHFGILILLAIAILDTFGKMKIT